MLVNNKAILDKTVFTALNQMAFGFNFIELESGAIQNTLKNEDRATLYDEHFSALLSSIIELLFGVNELNEDDDDYANKSKIVNAHMLFCTGFGQYPFSFDEMIPAKLVSQFPTVHDYILQYHQEKLNNLIEQGHDPKQSLFDFDIGDWIRFFDKHYNFHYGNLYSPINYLYTELDSDALIAELIPHSYVEGPNHNKETKLSNDDSIYKWDMILDANGLETLYEYLKQFSRQTMLAMAQELLKEIQMLPPKVYYLDPPQQYGESDIATKHIVMLNPQTAKKIRFEYFIEDIESMLAQDNELEKI